MTCPMGLYLGVPGPSMTYSCAYFTSPSDTLEAAQEQKHELICRNSCLPPGRGCSTSVAAGVDADPRRRASPRSRRRRDVVRASGRVGPRVRIGEAGLSELLEVRVADYREISDGPFDKVVSIGMYEHVGRSELGRYASTVRGLLRPGGMFLNHGIARLASKPPRGDTFISRYIFPAGELHPVAEIIDATQAAGLEVKHIESLREHYPLTLRRWAANLQADRAAVIASAGQNASAPGGSTSLAQPRPSKPARSPSTRSCRQTRRLFETRPAMLT